MKAQDILRAMAGFTWAIWEEAVSPLVHRLEKDAAGKLRQEAGPPTPELHPNPLVAEDSTVTASTGVVAVINVFGEIVPRDSALSWWSGGTSIERLRAHFRRALTDPSVRVIVLRVDSPGGMVDGVPEFAEEVFAAREVKPVIAIAEGMMASAAYYIGSAAKTLSVTPSGTVGSIGCICIHANWQRAFQEAGIDLTIIRSEKYKGEGNPYEPLSEEAQAELQSKVDAIGQAFRASVAKHRGVTVKQVKEQFGQGRMFLSAEAKSVGLVDRIETMDQLLARVMGKKKGEGARADDETPAATVAAPQDDPVLEHEALAWAVRSRQLAV